MTGVVGDARREEVRVTHSGQVNGDRTIAGGGEKGLDLASGAGGLGPAWKEDHDRTIGRAGFVSRDVERSWGDEINRLY